MEAFKDPPAPSSYTRAQITAYLNAISLPLNYAKHIENPETFPKTANALRTLMRCQITTFPFENLAIHYSPTHVVDIRPEVLYEKMMGVDQDGRRGRGGYCMEVGIFFDHMLRGLGFWTYTAGVRNRMRSNVVPWGEFLGWTHIVNIVHLPSGEKFALDIAFGGDGPTTPLPMLDDEPPPTIQNLGPQQVRLVHDTMSKQRLQAPKVWIYQYRNGEDKEWNSYYTFPEMECFQEDFEVMNWWMCTRTPYCRIVLAVKFLREGNGPNATTSLCRDEDEDEVPIVGKIMLVNDTVKMNTSGKTKIIHTFHSEEGRLQALQTYFGMRLTREEAGGIHGWHTALGQRQDQGQGSGIPEELYNPYADNCAA